MKRNLLVIALLLNIVSPMFTQQAQAKEFVDIVKGTTGVVWGVAAGPVIGGLRGLGAGFIRGTKSTAEAFGNEKGIPHNVVAAPTGGVVGGAVGLGSGIIMGAVDGLRYGWEKPWTPESFSAGGDSLFDYDPFDYPWE